MTISLTTDAEDGLDSHLAHEYLESVRRELKSSGPAPGLEEVRRRLSKIPGELTADFIADRGEDR